MSYPKCIKFYLLQKNRYINPAFRRLMRRRTLLEMIERSAIRPPTRQKRFPRQKARAPSSLANRRNRFVCVKIRRNAIPETSAIPPFPRRAPLRRMPMRRRRLNAVTRKTVAALLRCVTPCASGTPSLSKNNRRAHSHCFTKRL